MRLVSETQAADIIGCERHTIRYYRLRNRIKPVGEIRRSVLYNFGALLDELSAVASKPEFIAKLVLAKRRLQADTEASNV